MDVAERVAAGLREQARRRAARLAAGERRLGWKAGLGAPAHLALLGTDGPLVGYLTDAGRVESGGAWSLGGRVAPKLEPEIAVRLGADVAPDARVDDARAAIAALAPAIELVDIDLPLDDPEPVLAGNIFHRAVVLGAFRAGSDADGLALSVRGEREAYVAGVDPLALVGDLAAIVLRVAQVAASMGEAVRAGDVIITGSAVPPIAVDRAERVEVDLGGTLGAVTVRLTD